MTIPRRTFIKNTAIGAMGLSFTPLLSQSLFAAAPANSLPHSLPESEGITSASILKFIDFAEQKNLGLHSLMIVRNGNIVANGWWDPYKPELRHMLFSLSKSFTSTAIGFAVTEGLLTVEDKVTKFFPNDLPETISPYLQQMQVKHLLTMTSGHDKDTAALMRKSDEPWTKTFLSLTIPHEPGTFFFYNSGATYMLSAIVTKLTGKTVLDYLTPRIFKPLHIEGADWEVSPQGINTGAYGLRIKTEDIAKLGLLYLQNGIWNGKRVLSEDWINKATTYKVSNASLKGKDESSDWQQGYCYQFWRCRHNFFRGDGAMGQYCLVSRDLNTVIAITSETANMQAILDAVWDNLLPGIQAAPLPSNPAGQSALKEKLASLTLFPKKAGSGKGPWGELGSKTFTIANNAINISSASLTFYKDNCIFILKDNTTEHKVTCGLNEWVKAETLMPGAPPNLVLGNNKQSIRAKVAAAGVWVDDKTFVMTLQYFETPHADTITCHFDSNNIRIEFLSSIAAKSGSFKESRPVLEGVERII
jgi:CubicO group peptidase (beta-lactamase class C family)